MKTIVITSWYFNPIHPWHIDCFEMSKQLWDELWVVINNDKQAFLKRWIASFQDENYRMRVVASLRVVDKVILAIDSDGSVCASLRTIFSQIRQEYGKDIEIIFTKWGDRFTWNIPEVQICNEFSVKIVDWLWDKTHSSRDYLQKNIVQ